MKISLYVTMYGNCKKAIEFYQKVFNVKNLKIVTFEEAAPMLGIEIQNSVKNLIFRGELEIDTGNSNFSLVLADSPAMIFSDSFSKNPNIVDNISLEILDSNIEWIEKVFNELKKDGKVNIELKKTFNSELYGSVMDKFGICWLIGYESK